MNTLINTDNGDTIHALPLLKNIYSTFKQCGYYFPRSAPDATTSFLSKRNLLYDLLEQQPYITSFGFIDMDFHDKNIFLNQNYSTDLKITEVYFDKLNKLSTSEQVFRQPVSSLYYENTTSRFISESSDYIIHFIPNLYWSPQDPNSYLYPLSYLIDLRFDLKNSFSDKWLFLDSHEPLHDKKIAIGRTARYTEDISIMKTLLDKFGKNNFIFLGLPSEYENFCKHIDKIDYLETKNLLEAAKALNTVDLYIGNQSCLLAIAEALKLNIICEASKYVPNCNFSLFRNNFWYTFIHNDEILLANDGMKEDSATILEHNLIRKNQYNNIFIFKD